MLEQTRSNVGLRIKARDAKHLDPTERAELVNSFLFAALGLSETKDMITNPLFWDLLSYLSELFNVFAMRTGEQETLDLAQMLNSYLKSLHYSVPDSHAMLGPEREEHKQIWLDRIECVTEVLED